MTVREKAELRTVAAVMRSCAAALPASSLIAHELAASATRLNNAVLGQVGRRPLAIVRDGG